MKRLGKVFEFFCLKWVRSPTYWSLILLGVIKLLKYAFPIETLLTIYNTLLICHFNYCLTVLGSNTDKLFPLQKKSIRIISCNSYLTHTGPIFKWLGLLTLFRSTVFSTFANISERGLVYPRIFILRKLSSGFSPF